MRQNILQEREQMLDRAAQSAMQQAQDLNATYIGQVAHDLRTPLNSFKLGLQTAQSLERCRVESSGCHNFELTI